VRVIASSPELRPGEARLPWDDPVFSARMLREHLNEHHDLASRRPATIDAHVDWLRTLMPARGRVLDLACGPGLHLERFAASGSECIGIDVAPAAIEHATHRAAEAGLSCTYGLGDVRDPPVTGSFDLVLCLFGELSTFAIDDVRLVLEHVARHLAADGRAVIEVSTRTGVVAKGERQPSWYRADGGLFADGPHLVLRESRWFVTESASVERWWVLCDGDEPTMYGSTTWWHGDALDAALADAGLTVEQRVGDLTGGDHDDGSDFETLVLRRS